MDPQSLSNTVWAFATLSFHDAPLLEALASESLRKLPKFNLMECGNTGWAFARLAVRDDNLFDHIFHVILERPEDLDFQAVHALCCTTWSLGRGDLTWEIFEGRARKAIGLDSTSYGFLLMHSSWGGDQQREIQVLSALASVLAVDVLRPVAARGHGIDIRSWGDSYTLWRLRPFMAAPSPSCIASRVSLVSRTSGGSRWQAARRQML